MAGSAALAYGAMGHHGYPHGYHVGKHKKFKYKGGHGFVGHHKFKGKGFMRPGYGYGHGKGFGKRYKGRKWK